MFITPEKIELLERLSKLPIETDEDYQNLAEIYNEDFEAELEDNN